MSGAILPTVDVTQRNGWYPVASSSDAAPRHVGAARLWGSDLAVWRDDNGVVNVWPDRCLHRGVQLTIGANSGADLICRYHGWRYATRTGSCTYIPAHPANAPAQTICTATLPAVEYAGLIWTTLDGAASADDPGVPGSGDQRAFPFDAGVEATPLRSMTVAMPAASLVPLTNKLAALLTETLGAEVVALVQPVDPWACVLRPLVLDATPTVEHHALAARLVWEFVVDAETLAPEATVEGEPAVGDYWQVSSQGKITADAQLSVEVRRKWRTAEDVLAFELASVDGTPMPAAQPGAHIDVQLPGGIHRPYSLTGKPGDPVYRIGVKREPASRGGSVALHDAVHVGDRLVVSAPRNTFVLRRDAEHTVFIAGGIGVTPLLSMAQTLALNGASYEFHYFVQSADHMAFAEVLETLNGVQVHEGLDPSATATALQALLATPTFGHQVYACGPGPMLETIASVMVDAGWDADSLHVEYFRNDAERSDASTFTVALARSAVTLEVPAGASILDVLRENGVVVESSCEQGACGSCVVPVVSGTAVHQDVYLSATARQTNVAVCVSRAAEGETLVLDI